MIKNDIYMNRNKPILILSLIILAHICVNAQIESKDWCGNIDVEYSFGLAGYASDYGYMSAGVAASYGLQINGHYYAGVGIKPNYIFARDDFDGFFLPIYGEFKYKSSINDRQFGGFGLARVGYSPLDKRGIYAHIGGGLSYKKWDFGLGVSYQFAQFKEKYDDSVSYLDYNMVFATLSIGYNF